MKNPEIIYTPNSFWIFDFKIHATKNSKLQKNAKIHVQFQNSGKNAKKGKMHGVSKKQNLIICKFLYFVCQNVKKSLTII